MLVERQKVGIEMRRGRFEEQDAESEGGADRAETREILEDEPCSFAHNVKYTDGYVQGVDPKGRPGSTAAGEGEVT